VLHFKILMGVISNRTVRNGTISIRARPAGRTRLSVGTVSRALGPTDPLAVAYVNLPEGGRAVACDAINVHVLFKKKKKKKKKAVPRG
jgi:hypothetical protein